jgi:hypothetical protein
MSRNGNQIWHASTLLLLAVALTLASSAPAFAATVTDRPLLFSFDGHDTTAGSLIKPNKIAIDDSTGDIYVSEGPRSSDWKLNEAVSEFNPDGTAAEFSATGTSSLFGTPEGPFGFDVAVAVDDCGPNMGRLYVFEGANGRLDAFAPSGEFLWSIPGLPGDPERADVAVDCAGHPWVLSGSSLYEFESSGSPPTEIPSGYTNAFSNPRGLDIAQDDAVYVSGFAGVSKYVNGSLASVLDPAASPDVFADQSSPTGHIFTSHFDSGDFNEYDSGGTLSGTYGAGAIAVPRGIAYDHSRDRVYIANDGLNLVEAFGPPITGTAPDASIEATTVEGPGTATFHGTVNPQGAATAYYFEWAEGSVNAPFSTSGKHYFRSPAFTALPADSSSHSVEYKATNLLGATKWDVRLVALNTENGLRAASGPDTFEPPKATAGPVVTVSAPSQLHPTSAEIAGTVNPKEDSAIWLVEYTDDEACESDWAFGTIEYLPGGEVNAPLPVEYALEGLLPSTSYCVRIRAHNSFELFGAGSVSPVERFTTAALPPSEVTTAFAGPRTDTGARLNGRVNPGGNAHLEYQFEWSEDGTSWNELPLRTESVRALSPIVVSDQLTGLQPATSYYYRLSLVRNETGSATEVGEVKSFTTRSSAEMLLPTNGLGEPNRPGIELVNSPDKGNQNVFLETVVEIPAEVPHISADGEQARWGITAGAPGTPTGVGAQFLAHRLPGPTPAFPSGWESRSLEPPASEQPGEGSMAYNVSAASSDQQHFIADLRSAGLAKVPASTVVRLDTHQHEEVLARFEWPADGEEELAGIDVSDDGAHVLTVDPETRELVDIGTGTAEVVSVMPDGTPSQCGLASRRSSASGSVASFVGGREWRNGYHQMATTDANIVYFLAKPNGECGKPWGLYVRDRSAGTTTRIDPGVEGHTIEFIRATPDGTRGYFLTGSRLDPADGNVSVDLYRWDNSTGESTCLTCVVSNASIAPSAGGGTNSPVMVSDDFSHAYFVSHRRLVPDEGIDGAQNIYVLSGGTLRFVGTAADFAREPLSPGATQLSADGKSLIFPSSRGDASQLTSDRIDCGGCPQLYRWDDHEESLECLSCNPSGPTDAPFSAGNGKVDWAMSADGSTVGFVTPQGLVRSDVNGGIDVYQWRDGALRLITDGVSEPQTGAAAPAVAALDADGSNMLFSVAQPGITGFERDGLSNLYDARIGGGFPVPSPAVHCDGDSCQGPLEAAPALAALGSAGASRGNVKPPHRPCRKGWVRRHHHCVKRHRRHRHHHRNRRLRTAHAGPGRSR